MRATLPLLLALAACGGSGPVTVVTYNAGLAPGFVDGAASRTPLIAAAVASLDADVVCLQEVWTPGDIAAVKAATAQAFPHQLWPEGGQETLDDAGCTTEETGRLIGCVRNNCSEVCDEFLDDCMLANCGVSFINVSRTCQGCVMANVGADVDAVEATCTTSFPQYAYEGSFGTAVLSRHPIVESDHHELSATTNRRGVHHAVVRGPAGRMDVYCTHLTAVFSVLPYPREQGTWASEQRAQVTAMRRLVDDTARTDKVVLMGDFNTGPAGDGLVAEQPESWAALTPGYTVPYVDAGGACTWCPDNPLIGGGDPHILDHVLVKGFSGAPATRRILDEGATIDVCDEVTQGALSDHYGVEVTLTP
jgi:endonuclease/exonuclease/phosphatase family metal-dependent hydrolase